MELKGASKIEHIVRQHASSMQINAVSPQTDQYYAFNFSMARVAVKTFGTLSSAWLSFGIICWPAK